MSQYVDVIDVQDSERLETVAMQGWSDWLGIVASVGCAIHCAMMPFVIAYLPALGLSFLSDEGFHQWMAIACLFIALTAFVPGLRKHGRLTPVVIGALGLSMISFAAFGFAGDCCAGGCESDVSTVALQNDGAIHGVLASTETAAGEGAIAACCLHCEADSNSLPTSVAGIGVIPSHWLAFAAPWLTPFGGFVLVGAHLLNRRLGCLCGCCEEESA